jgi:hypothetical protein
MAEDAGTKKCRTATSDVQALQAVRVDLHLGDGGNEVVLAAFQEGRAVALQAAKSLQPQHLPRMSRCISSLRIVLQMITCLSCSRSWAVFGSNHLRRAKSHDPATLVFGQIVKSFTFSLRRSNV